MASSETALAAFRKAVGEVEFERVTTEAEISRLVAGNRPVNEDDAEVARILQSGS